MPATSHKSRLALHFASGPEIGSALCNRQTFQSAKSVLRGKVIHPTPTVTTEAEDVTCKRCLRLLGALLPIDSDDQDEEQFQ